MLRHRYHVKEIATQSTQEKYSTCFSLAGRTTLWLCGLGVEAGNLYSRYKRTVGFVPGWQFASGVAFAWLAGTAARTSAPRVVDMLPAYPSNSAAGKAGTTR